MVCRTRVALHTRKLDYPKERKNLGMHGYCAYERILCTTRRTARYCAAQHWKRVCSNTYIWMVFFKMVRPTRVRTALVSKKKRLGMSVPKYCVYERILSNWCPDIKLSIAECSVIVQTCRHSVCINQKAQNMTLSGVDWKCSQHTRGLSFSGLVENLLLEFCGIDWAVKYAVWASRSRSTVHT